MIGAKNKFRAQEVMPKFLYEDDYSKQFPSGDTIPSLGFTELLGGETDNPLFVILQLTQNTSNAKI
jgi:hypothetical protein